jgi:hypothetical protein
MNPGLRDSKKSNHSYGVLFLGCARSGPEKIGELPEPWAKRKVNQASPSETTRLTRWPANREDRTPTHGYEATREAAMAAFAKSWRREGI